MNQKNILIAIGGTALAIMVIILFYTQIKNIKTLNPKYIKDTINTTIATTQHKILSVKTSIGIALVSKREKEVSVYFDNNTSELKPDEKLKLDDIVKLCKKFNQASITILGYTDASGNDNINIPLSVNRTKAVKDYLGVACSSIDNIGFGSSIPERKVSIKILY